MSISLPKRTIAVGLAIAVAFSLTGLALVFPVAYADDTTAHTIEQLQDQINSLQAQLAALSGGSGSGGACFAFTRDLYNGVGSGTDVTALQDYLTGTGHFTFSGGSTGFFGPITQTAVAAWQSANGVSPPAGYFGPISRTQYNSMCTPGDGGDGDGGADVGDLEGEEGTFKNFELLGDPSSETVFEADTQNVLGWKYEAQDSDLRTERVRVRFDGTDGTNSTVGGSRTNKPWKIVKEVCLLHGTDEVACEDADSSSDWSEATTNIYEKTFAGLTEVTREGDESEFFVQLRTLSTIDSSENDEQWTVSVRQNGVRAEDAAGEDVTGPGDNTTIVETFTLDTDPQGKLELNLDSDKNEDHVIEADSTSNTTDVVLLTWEQEVKEGAVTITDLAVRITTASAGGTGGVGDILASIDIYRDGSKIKTESVASGVATTTITFDNIDQTQDVNTEEWMIKGKVKKLDGVALGFNEADGVILSIQNGDVTAEAGNSDTVTVTGGTVTGGEVIFYTEGIQVAFVDASASKVVDGAANSTDDEGEFVIRFDVTAFGSDIYVQDGATEASLAVGGNAGASATTTTGTVDAATTTSVTLDHDGTNGSNSNFKVGKSNTQRFTLTVSITANTGSTDFVRAALTAVGWATSDVSTSTALYTFDLSEYETPQITLVPRT